MVRLGDRERLGPAGKGIFGRWQGRRASEEEHARIVAVQGHDAMTSWTPTPDRSRATMTRQRPIEEEPRFVVSRPV